MSSHAISLPSAPTPHQWRRWLSLENRFVPPVFITLILLIGNLSFGILESWTRTALAITIAIATELTLGKVIIGKWPNIASAYISGISIGILLRSPAVWPYCLAAVLAISSKYVVRYRNRHLWNPSNFAICVVLFLAADTVSSLSIQWGNNLAAMAVIWLLGSAILYRLRRFHICAAYVGSFLAFAVLRHAITGEPLAAELAPITGPEYQLFIFFMITDPKTTLRSRRGQCLVVVAVAAVECVLRLHSSIYAPLYALFLVGPPALLMSSWWNARLSAKQALAPIPVSS